jgi:hypothetical protein
MGPGVFNVLETLVNGEDIPSAENRSKIFFRQLNSLYKERLERDQSKSHKTN